MKWLAIAVLLFSTPVMADTVSGVGKKPVVNMAKGYVITEKQCVFLGKVNNVDLWAGACRPRDDADPYLEPDVQNSNPTGVDKK